MSHDIFREELVKQGWRWVGGAFSSPAVPGHRYAISRGKVSCGYLKPSVWGTYHWALTGPGPAPRAVGLVGP